MKKPVIILGIIALIAGSCGGRATKKQDKVNHPETELIFEIKEKFVDSEDFGNKENPLCGIIYKNIEDIPELQHYQNYYGGWSVFENIADGGYKKTNISIEYYKDNNENIVCILTEFLQHDEKGKPIRKILDTVNITKLKVGEQLTWGDCYRDTINDSGIVAVYIVENEKEFFDNFIKAWRADIKTGKMQPIKNLKGISCYNKEYGRGGEGYEHN